MRVLRTPSAQMPLCPSKSVTRDPHTARQARQSLGSRRVAPVGWETQDGPRRTFSHSVLRPLHREEGGGEFRERRKGKEERSRARST